MASFLAHNDVVIEKAAYAGLVAAAIMELRGAPGYE